MRTCFLSIDVEKKEGQKEQPFDGVDNLDNILNIFKKYNLPATLFVTGEVLESAPDLVKKWSKNFEIAGHGYWHVQLDKIDLPERERQIKDFVNLYKSIFGCLPRGFRAPRNVIDNNQFPILERYGFVYDASVFPRYPFRVGAYTGYRGRAPIQPYWPNKANYKKRGESNILEIPESPAAFDIPLVGTWVRKLGIKFFKFIFKIKKPNFISFNMHSCDGVRFRGDSSKNSGKEFLKRLDVMLKFLKDYGYNFKTGEEIYDEMARNK